MAQRTPKPKAVKKTEKKATSIRFTDGMYVGIDKATDQIKSERPGQDVDRSDTVRTLIGEALRARNIEIV